MIKIRRLLYIIIIILELLFFGYLKLNEHFLHHLSDYTSTIPDDGIISYSIEPGIYDHSITVDLKNELGLINKDVKILYSLDGNDPYYNNSYLSEEKETVVFNPYEYDESIKIDVKEKDIVVVPIKAVVYYNGQYSKIVEKTYIVSDGDINQYTDLPIISISSNQYNLYDYYDGLLNVGYGKYLLFDQGHPQYMLGNATIDGRQIDGSVTFFNLSEINYDYYNNVEISLSGQSSLKSPVKSFKIKSPTRDFYVTKYHKYADFYNNPTSFKTLKLRGGSADLYNTNIRSAIGSNIAYDMNSNISFITQQAIVYLNGNFYGIVDIQNNYSSSNLMNKYSLPDNNIEELKNEEETCAVDESLVSDDDFEKWINSHYDVDNLMQYLAIEFFMNNTDWPKGNIEKWRYRGKYDKNNKYTDGKYRFLLFDVDLTFYNESYPFLLVGDDGDNFVTAFYNMNFSHCDLVYRILHNSNLKDKLLLYIFDLFNVMYKNDYYNNSIRDQFEELKTSLVYYENVNPNYSYDVMSDNVELLLSKVKSRKQELLKDIKDYYYFEKLYNFNIVTGNGIYVTWNNNVVFENDKFSTTYLEEISFEIEANESIGYKFDYWLIDGVKYYDKKLKINRSLINKGELTIEPISHYEDGDYIGFDEVLLDSNQPYIVVKNYSKRVINLKDYCVSISSTNICLPKVTLDPMAEYKIEGNKVSSNLKTCDTIKLLKGDTLVDELYINRLSKNEITKRYGSTGKFIYKTNN